MRTKTFKKLIYICSSFLLAIIMTLGLFNFSGWTVKGSADTEEPSVFSGFSGQAGLTTSELYSATNTYNYKGDNTHLFGSDTYRKYEYYDLSAKSNTENQNVVSTNPPQITALMHGLGGSAAHWNNHGGNVLAYDPDSLINQLEQTLLGAEGANIYWATMSTHDSFYLVDLKDSANKNEDNTYKIEKTISQITDNSKHIIVIVDVTNTAKDSYNTFQFVADEVV